MSNSDLTRRSFLGFSGAATVGSAISAASRIAQSEAATTNQITGHDSRRNIILFVADEMRADTLACYGNPVTKTPNFDRVASEGVKFANCHVQFPICGPSRCSMVTGWAHRGAGNRTGCGGLARWPANTTGIAPFDRDQRNCPRINEGRSAPDPGWQQALLDE